ncbi:AAA family ATPase [Parasedimentitalea psychrophila]|uniref:AAA family ATPase n=1 Tax=Parasedimentitalea psychrophila TaxID=2997337 RepID=A0A9Y2P6F6_9RHOB|nr:AAA family ATPase [Parasedimentitalea psychrophila]WIY27389.1 AAA family ATPase [Parasedimentitalea psychrophila]
MSQDQFNHPTDKNSSPLSVLGHPTISANDFTPDPNTPYIVQHLLHPGQVSMFSGPSNLGKSAIVACISAHVAMGRDFCGLRVSRAAILYVAAEAPKGVLNRAYPYLSQKAAGIAPFRVLDKAVDLSNPVIVKKLAHDANLFRDHHNCAELLIVFDTLNLCIGEGDENSSRDMGKVLANATFIAETTNAHVMIVHHMGASENGRPRGSTTLTANVDTGLTLHKADETQPKGTVFIKVSKQREDEKSEPIAFRIQGYEIGRNRHGELSTVPMAVPFKAHSSLIENDSPKPNKRGQLSLTPAREKDLLRVLSDLRAKDSGAWHTPKDIGQMSGEPFNNIRGNADTMRKKVRAALDALITKGRAEESKEGVRLRPSSAVETESNTPQSLH